jgi:hypothetical protein
MSLPPLDTPHPLSDTRIRDFRTKGHVHVPGLASPDEIAAYGPALQAAALGMSREKRPLAERDTYGRAFLQMINLWLVDETARRFVFSRRFARAAAELLGVDAVRLYHDQALFKEAGGGPTPWHQDQYYWPLDSDLTITLWMPLAPIPSEVGSMTFANGTHLLGDLGQHQIGDTSQRAFAQLISERGLETETHGALAAGDATFHRGWTLHSAGANPTAELRPAMTIIYFADGIRISQLDHPNRKLDRAAYLPGCEPGAPAVSTFCPRLHPRESDELPAPPRRDAAYWEAVRSALREVAAAGSGS